MSEIHILESISVKYNISKFSKTTSKIFNNLSLDGHAFQLKENCLYTYYIRYFEQYA